MKKLPHPICLYCGKESKRTTTKYCSVKCRQKDWAEKEIHFGGPPCTTDIPRECPYCKTTFLPNNYKKEQKFCNPFCAGKFRADETAVLGRSMKGTKRTAEQKAALSVAASKRNAQTTYTKGIGGYRKDLQCYFRSTWEANVARILKHESIHYRYEAEAFKLNYNNSDLHYIPDFKIESRYIEVKGWWNEQAILKKELMAQQYPEIIIEYIAEPEYNQLKEYYSEIINEWEFGGRGHK